MLCKLWGLHCTDKFSCICYLEVCSMNMIKWWYVYCFCRLVMWRLCRCLWLVHWPSSKMATSITSLCGLWTFMDGPDLSVIPHSSFLPKPHSFEIIRQWWGSWKELWLILCAQRYNHTVTWKKCGSSNVYLYCDLCDMICCAGLFGVISGFADV